MILTGAPGESAEVFGAADLPLVLAFEEPLRKERVAMPGAEVRPHPFRDNALILTPSRALAARGSALLSIPLADETEILLTLAFKPEMKDECVRIRRRSGCPATSFAGLGKDALQGTLQFVARALFVPTNREASEKDKGENNQEEHLRQRVVGGLSYLEVKSTSLPKCAPTSVRALGGQQDVEILLLDPSEDCTHHERCVFRIVVPTTSGGDYERGLELLEQDGSSCEQVPGKVYQAVVP